VLHQLQILFPRPDIIFILDARLTDLGRSLKLRPVGGTKLATKPAAGCCIGSLQFIPVTNVRSTAGLRHELGAGFEYDFVDGTHPWPAAPEIAQVFGNQQNCYSWYDGSAASVATAVDDLAGYVEENGPFDSVFAFSLASGLVATLLLRPTPSAVQPHIKSVVFMSASTLPCDWHELKKGNIRFLGMNDISGSIDIPTLSVWSVEDAMSLGRADELMRMCNEKRRGEVHHSAGHGIPARGTEVGAVAAAIRQMMAQLPGGNHIPAS